MVRRNFKRAINCQLVYTVLHLLNFELISDIVVLIFFFLFVFGGELGRTEHGGVSHEHCRSRQTLVGNKWKHEGIGGQPSFCC